jgi:hypothetical protein
MSEILDSKFGVMIMVFNATLNNISVISWRSVLLVGETGVQRVTCVNSPRNVITQCCVE